MTDKLRWDIAPLRDWVIQTHGRDQWRLANECLQSVFERRNLAIYHHHEWRRLLDNPASELDHFERLAWMLGAEVDGMKETFEPVRFKASAHVLAVVQSMHALTDTMAQVLRYVFCLQWTDPNYAPQAWKVRNRLPDGRIKQLLDELIEHKDAKYIEALSNRSKHHSIVRVNYLIPMNEGDGEGLRWPDFWNDGELHKSRPVRDTLVSEYQRQEGLLFAIYAELDVLATSSLAT